MRAPSTCWGGGLGTGGLTPGSALLTSGTSADVTEHEKLNQSPGGGSCPRSHGSQRGQHAPPPLGQCARSPSRLSVGDLWRMCQGPGLLIDGQPGRFLLSRAQLRQVGHAAVRRERPVGGRWSRRGRPVRAQPCEQDTEPGPKGGAGGGSEVADIYLGTLQSCLFFFFLY